MRTAESRILLDHASPRRKANATSTTATRINATPVKPARPTAFKRTALARSVAHEGGRTPTGSRTVSGEFGAPATTAIPRYPATRIPSDHLARTDVPSLNVVGARNPR